MSAGATTHGWRHQASTGTTRKPVGGMNASGMVPTTSTPGRVETDFLSRFPQRRRDGPLVAGVDGPAGEGQGWPACSRSSSLRTMNSRSGPPGPSPNKISTADARPPAAGGASSGEISNVCAAAASSRSHAGTASAITMPA